MDLEKAFDRVPREVVRWALRKMGVDEWFILTVMALYTEACTVIRTDLSLHEVELSGNNRCQQIEINSYPESLLFISTGFLPRVSSKRLN